MNRGVDRDANALDVFFVFGIARRVDRIVCDEREAFATARDIMMETVVRPNGHLQVLRMNDPSWSALTNHATLWWAYFAFESSQRVCWFVCFADPY